ncbi:MAG: 3'-5' exonuclease [Bacteroidales bacterium]|jgi:DNA polymerase-3 subunit epsilon|nr:3'-5' exonuclease [Bacteroidales bacterium]
MKLALKKPLVIFDLETTGLNIANDRIVEISYLKVFPDQHEESKTYRVNPTIHIPKEATAIHGICDDDVADAPTFSAIAHTLTNIFVGCDLAGYNSNKFDLPLLAEEFLRANIDFDLKKCRFIDVQVIFHKKEQRTLEAAYKFYCNKAMSNAHSAEADSRATYEVLQSQLDRYADLPHDIDGLSDFSTYVKVVDFVGHIILNDKQEEVFNFGKYKGQSVTTVLAKDPLYYSWMMNGNFPQYTKNVLTAIKLREFKNCDSPTIGGGTE